MKCYICFSAPKSDNDVYVDALEATLISARKNTTLDLIALYDGPENHRCFYLLKKYNVTILKHCFSHKKCLELIYPDEYKGKSCWSGSKNSFN